MSNTLHLTGPLPQVRAVEYGPSHVALAGPSAQISLTWGSEIALSVPSAQALAQMVQTPQGIGHLSAPAAALDVRGGAGVRVRAPSARLAMAGTTTLALRAHLSAPLPSVQARMTAGTVARAALSLPAAAMVLVQARGGVAPVRLRANAPTVQARGMAGAILTTRLVGPRARVQASGSVRGLSFAHLVAPSLRATPSLRAHLMAPRAQVSASGSLAPVQLALEVYAMNLRSSIEGGGDEVSRYTDWPFFSVVRAHGAYFGVSSAGLYRLGGDSDAGAPIDWAVMTAITDFDVPQKKRVASCYLSGRLGPQSTFTVQAGEREDNAYHYRTPRGQTAQNYRCTLGRGMNERYYAFGVSGQGPLEIDGLEFEVLRGQRRV